MTTMEKVAKGISLYVFGGLAAVMVAYPWLAQYVHLAKAAKEGDRAAYATLADLVEMHPDRMAVIHLISRVFPLQLRLVSEVLADKEVA